jgi:DNA mismatch repair protein MutS2
VHVASVGTGVVREARNGGRFLIEIKGRTILVAGSQMKAAPEGRSRSSPPQITEPLTTEAPRRSHASTSLDLHGKSAGEAVEILDAFLSDALLDGCSEVRVIHGRSGGRIKGAVHARLEQLPAVQSFRIDPGNPGVTIVSF